MALTPEDVVQKEFSKPKSFGRSGYDEGQVDDFLDEIVVELRRLNAQNDDLTDKLEDCRRGKSGGGDAKAATSGASGVPALTPVNRSEQGGADVAAKDDEIAKLKKELAQAREGSSTQGGDVAKVAAERDEAKRELEAAQARVQDLEKQLAAGEPTAADHAAALQGTTAGAADAASVIALAQRVHDQHVKEGETERDRLVSEAKAHHDKVIGEADAKSEELLSSAKKRHEELLATGQSKHDELVASGQKQHDELVSSGKAQSTKLVSDAEQRRTTVLAELEQRRTSLNSEIEKLKKFESDYRSNLKGYFNEQLRLLDAKSVEPAKDAKDSETKNS